MQFWCRMIVLQAVLQLPSPNTKEYLKDPSDTRKLKTQWKVFYIQPFSFMLNKWDYILPRPKFEVFLPFLSNPLWNRIHTHMYVRGKMQPTTHTTLGSALAELNGSPLPPPPQEHTAAVPCDKTNGYPLEGGSRSIWFESMSLFFRLNSSSLVHAERTSKGFLER